MINRLIILFLRVTLWFRYRIRVTGFEEVLSKGKTGILFLPNHPALIDPVIVMSRLLNRFKIRPIGFEDQVERPLVNWFSKRLNVLKIPRPGKAGAEGRQVIDETISRIVEALKNGENILLYPSGHRYRKWLEDLGANSGVESILAQIPDVRIVTIRTHGLWGSAYSLANGKAPKVARILIRAFFATVFNGIFFSPKRKITMEMHEPEDFPRTADRMTINRYLENFYNQNALPNTWVPLMFWSFSKPRVMPEPPLPVMKTDLKEVPKKIQEEVCAYLGTICDKKDIHPGDILSRDLGLDSLSCVEAVLWVEQTYGFQHPNADAVLTVADLFLAACGQVAAVGESVKNPSNKWFDSFRNHGGADIYVAEGAVTIAEAFLAKAEESPGRVIIADANSGEKTWSDLILACLLLKPLIEKLPGERIGIMLPAIVAADVAYLASLFAGKTVVMLNWTVGPSSLEYARSLMELEAVLTVRPLVGKLKNQGTDLSPLEHQFVYLEDLGASLGTAQKIKALIKARLGFWDDLRRAEVSDLAAVVFTSGSESLPKAVPLSQRNILHDLRSAVSHVHLRDNDALVGFMPPFHSLGFTGNLVLPLVTGIPTYYHANPTDSVLLAQMITATRASIFLGTPTFARNILRAAKKGELSDLRLSVLGGEKVPEILVREAQDKLPNYMLLEGWGITECSPLITANPPGAAKQNSVGTLLDCFECVLVDPELLPDEVREVPQGERGMPIVSGPAVFSGYFCYDGPSPFVTYKGKQWYCTGDLMTVDEEGYYFFAGRLKRFVKIAGEMISLPAVEAALGDLFGNEKPESGPVLAVDTIGDEQHPELVLIAFKEVERAEANRHIAEAGLSPLYNIRHVIQLDEIPILGTGKTNYRELRKILDERFA